MSVANDIARSYRAPREVIRRRLEGAREDRALAILIAGCGLMFVAQWPALARAAHLDPAVPLEARLGGALMGWLFIVPLVAYGVAAASRLVAMPFGGRGSWMSARLALFWAILAASPLWLLNGLVAGLIGHGPALQATTLLAGVAFLAIWGAGLWETETGPGRTA